MLEIQLSECEDVNWFKKLKALKFISKENISYKVIAQVCGKNKSLMWETLKK